MNRGFADSRRNILAQVLVESVGVAAAALGGTLDLGGARPRAGPLPGAGGAAIGAAGTWYPRWRGGVSVGFYGGGWPYYGYDYGYPAYGYGYGGAYCDPRQRLLRSVLLQLLKPSPEAKERR